EAITADAARALARELRVGRERGLKQLQTADVVAAVARALALLTAGGGEQVARLAETTGYHPTMVRRALRDLETAFSSTALEQLLRRELGRPEVLDGFVPRADGAGLERAYGPALTVIVLSGNVFPVVVESVTLALL